jgi:hypothetical protein
MSWLEGPENGAYSIIGLFARVGSENDEAYNHTLLDFISRADSESDEKTWLSLLTCSIEAAWQQAEYELQATANYPLFSTKPLKPPTGHPHTRIRIDQRWAHTLYDSRQMNMKYSYQFRDYYKDWENNEDPTTLEWYLAGLFALGLSELHPELHSYRNNFTCDEYAQDFPGDGCTSPTQLLPDTGCPTDYSMSNNECNQIHLTVRVQGFGYNIEHLPVRASIGILTAYCLLVGCYIFDVVIVTRSASTAWGSAAELVALALRSKDPQILGSTSVGLENKNTFSQPVGVRVNEEEELELIFMNDEKQVGRHLEIIEANKEY